MIQVKHLSKSYKRKNKTNVILKNVNITLFDVGLVYIIGPSGCGKSTLLNIFEGIDNDYEGDVFINDTNIRKLKGKAKRMFFKNNIGIVSQASNLFESLTVYQNLLLTCYIKGINKSIIDEYLKKYKLEKLKNHKVSTLSGGEKQRISLIRAIVNKPKIIFADEPTGALDKDNAQILMDELYELSKTTLVIIVTHNLNLINKYKGSIIEIKDKEVEIKENLTINTNYVRYSKLVKEKDYSNLFIDSSFKSNKAKNIISFISLFVGLFLIFGSFSLNEGFNLNRDNIYEKNINSNVVKIYKNDYEDISKSKLSLVKKKRPSIENIQTFLCSFENINIYYNFDFYITNKLIKINNIESNEYNLKFYFSSSYENKILVNDIKKENIDSISITLDKSFQFYEPTSKYKTNERFYFENTYNSYNIIKEFKYLNEPTIYLPYFYFLDYLRNNIATQISIVTNKKISFLDLVYLCLDDSNISSYSMYVAISNNDIKRIRNLMTNISNSNKPIYKLESEYFFIIDSFVSLIQALLLGIKMFIIVICLCNMFLIGFLTYSTVKKEKRIIAILRVLGSKEEYINNIFLNEGLIILFISLASSLLIFYISKTLINKKLYDFFVVSNLMQISLSNLVLIVLSIIIIFISLYLFLLGFSKRLSVKEELKEE